MSYLIRLEAGRYPCVLLQGTPGVVVRLGVALVDVGAHLPGLSLQLHLARHGQTVRLGFSENINIKSQRFVSTSSRNTESQH